VISLAWRLGCLGDGANEKPGRFISSAGSGINEKENYLNLRREAAMRCRLNASRCLRRLYSLGFS
jgi:hypothetical protein